MLKYATLLHHCWYVQAITGTISDDEMRVTMALVQLACLMEGLPVLTATSGEVELITEDMAKWANESVREQVRLALCSWVAVGMCSP